jgi:hypothetical protein
MTYFKWSCHTAHIQNHQQFMEKLIHLLGDMYKYYQIEYITGG